MLCTQLSHRQADSVTHPSCERQTAENSLVRHAGNIPTLKFSGCVEIPAASHNRLYPDLFVPRPQRIGNNRPTPRLLSTATVWQRLYPEQLRRRQRRRAYPRLHMEWMLLRHSIPSSSDIHYNVLLECLLWSFEREPLNVRYQHCGEHLRCLLWDCSRCCYWSDCTRWV
jgi:hypothetical protein